MGFNGRRLKDLRRYKNITQEELAKSLNYKKATICNWETGQNTPNYETLKALCLSLGTSADFLIGLTDEHAPNVYNQELPVELRDKKISEVDIIRHLNIEDMTLQEILDAITMSVMHFKKDKSGLI
jgi:transcriptional regulator with XRE-family HTH domain